MHPYDLIPRYAGESERVVVPEIELAREWQAGQVGQGMDVVRDDSVLFERIFIKRDPLVNITHGFF